jgi:hypothetical protein
MFTVYIGPSPLAVCGGQFADRYECGYTRSGARVAQSV